MAKTLVYQFYPVAWPTGLKGMTDHLKTLAELGVDFVWASLLIDHRSIDARFGTMSDFDDFVKEAHRFGMGVLTDITFGELNQEFVREYRDAVEFWSKQHKVNGFCLNLSSEPKENTRLLDAVFGHAHSDDRLILAKCVDKSFGDLADYYYSNTAIDYCFNPCLKEQIDHGYEVFGQAFEKSARNNNVIIDLETYDAPNFTGRSGRSARDILKMLFTSSADAICLFQGQELGLEYSDSYEPFPTEELKTQINDPHSILNLVIDLVNDWKQR